MLGAFVAIAKNIHLEELTAGGPLSALWQILAIVAVAGIVIIVILAIIEPGPLVKRRPFSRKERTRGSGSEVGIRNSPDPHSTPDRADKNLGQNDGG